MTEHEEEWHWPSGEKVVIPFVSVHEFRDGELHQVMGSGCGV